MATLRRARLGLLGGIVLALGVARGPGDRRSAGDPCFHGFDFPQRTVATTSRVSALNCAFAPTIARIPVGGTVTFKDLSGFGHLVTGANQEWGERDKELPANGTISYTFDEAGPTRTPVRYTAGCRAPSSSGKAVTGVRRRSRHLQLPRRRRRRAATPR